MKAQLGFSMPLFLPSCCLVVAVSPIITVELTLRPLHSWARYFFKLIGMKFLNSLKIEIRVDVGLRWVELKQPTSINYG